MSTLRGGCGITSVEPAERSDIGYLASIRCLGVSIASAPQLSTRKPALLS